MTGTPLSKYTNKVTEAHGSRVRWNRADLDGLPFLGATRELYTEDEYQERAVVDKFFQFRVFHLNNPADARDYADVCDRIVNGWYRLIFRQALSMTRDEVIWYVEWAEQFMTDGTPTAAASIQGNQAHAGQ